MQRIKIDRLLNASDPISQVLVKGWVRTKRDAKDFSFVEMNDGSCLANIQIIADSSLKSYGDVRKLTTGSSVMVIGALVPSQGKGQQWELQAEQVTIVQLAPYLLVRGLRWAMVRKYSSECRFLYVKGS